MTDAFTGDLVVCGIGELTTPGPGGGWDTRTYRNAYVVIEGGTVTEVGEGSPPDGDRVLDVDGRAVVPAFCDPHTHAVFGDWRAREFALRLRGADYKEILTEGGGILETVSATRASEEEELLDELLRHLDVMLSCGVLTCEVKSGYGLDRANEIKMLRVISRANSEHPVEVVPTFLGAHAVPPEWRGDPDGYIENVVLPLIDEVAGSGLAEFVDVFCEPGVFTVQQSRVVLEAAREAGLDGRIHADEMEAAGGTQLAADVGCASAEHLLAAPEDELRSLREAGVTPVLLPGTAFMLQKPYARARWMIDEGLDVALGTDFNPGSCPIIDIKLIMSLAAIQMSMTPAEVMVAVTRNAAQSLNRDDRGAIAPGLCGDLVVLDAPDHVHLIYRPGAPLVRQVIRGGVLVYDRYADGCIMRSV